jgi:hydrogenase maturation protease
LGIGNILLRDEGVGIHVIKAMQAIELSDNIELFDGGTMGLDLLNVVADRHQVVVIDAIQRDHEPGTVFSFSPDDFTPQGVDISLHDIGLLETLRMSKYLGCAPQQIVIFGIEPKEMGYGLDLSSVVAAAVPHVIQLVLAYLAKMKMPPET